MNSCQWWVLFLCAVLFCVVVSVRMGLIEDEKVAGRSSPPLEARPRNAMSLETNLDELIIRICETLRKILSFIVALMNRIYISDSSSTLQHGEKRLFHGTYMHRGAPTVRSTSSMTGHSKHK
ncbi:hypothetical protein QR680_011247 [Steinernema hermaphroditum]|uniref:Uncharacterized protein n=1 Tax=Steinernema hermaphroditum TaxID=289476 RepID=A0AA39MD08_9BILA|nr:hypothetical protein QR680_011247 [Steinernema hermaphroditum]